MVSLAAASVPADHLGTWVAAAVAVFAATLAAATAQWRQRQQLRADERRLRLQLRHDRDLQDIAELKDLLDAVIGHVTTALDGARELEMVVEYMVSEPALGQQESGMKTVSRAWSKFSPLKADWDRLVLRLGYEHPVVTALATLRTDLHFALGVPGRSTGPFDDATRSEMIGAMDVVREDAKTFIREANRAVGVVLPTRDEPGIGHNGAAPEKETVGLVAAPRSATARKLRRSAHASTRHTG